MTDGFKSGSGDDPFAEDDDTSAADTDPFAEQDDQETENHGTTEEPLADLPDDLPERRDRQAQDPAPEQRDMPWVIDRESVKDGRPRTMEFRMRPETAQRRREFMTAVENELGKDVYALDLREAAYLVAMNHVDEVAEQLRDWGYDYL